MTEREQVSLDWPVGGGEGKSDVDGDHRGGPELGRVGLYKAGLETWVFITGVRKP